MNNRRAESETARHVVAASFRELFDEATVLRLERCGVHIDSFVWLVPDVVLTFRSGRVEAGAFCGGLADGRTVIFPVPDQDESRIDGLLRGMKNRAGRAFALHEMVQFDVAEFSREAIRPQVLSHDSTVELRLELSDRRIDCVSFEMTPEMLRAARGDWLRVWRDIALAEMGVGREQALGVVKITRWAPMGNRFGAVEASTTQPLFFASEALRSFPHGHLPSLRAERWNIQRSETEPSVSILGKDGGLPILVQFAEFPVNGHEVAIESLQRHLASAEPSEISLHTHFGSFGSFRAKDGRDGRTRDIVLRRTESGIEQKMPEEKFYEWGFAIGENVVLASNDGAHLQVALSTGKNEELLGNLKPLKELLPCEDGQLVAVVIREHGEGTEGEKHGPAVSLTLGRASTFVGEHERIDHTEVSALELTTLESGVGRLAVDIAIKEGIKRQHVFVGPEKLMSALCAEWEIRRTDATLAGAQIARLYVEFNESKKFNLLSALFGDVLLLNQQLNMHVTMEELLREIENRDETDFSSDKRLREATMDKVAILSVTLPRLKQKMELIRAVYPYYWTQQDATWLESVYGQRCGALVAQERRRAVPRVRHEVMQVQHNTQRSLAGIEEALRPLEALQSRERVQKQWFAQLTRYAPPLLYAGAAVTAVATAGASGVVMPMAMPILAGVVGSGVGLTRGEWANSKEAELQFQRAAKTIFPWWQVFLRTLTVSIYETALFIDEENARAMQRDRQLFDQLPAAEKTNVLQILEKNLRERIFSDLRASFMEVLEGSGLRLHTVICDLQRTLDCESAQFALDLKN